jgi:kynurenine formamidase
MCSPEVLAVVQRRLSGMDPMSRRRALGLSGAMVAGAVALPGLASAQQATPVGSPGAVPAVTSISVSSVVDLTHVMTPETPVWPGNEAFSHEIVRDYGEHGFYAQSLTYWEHTGTHLDAPAHFVEGADTAEVLPVANFLAPLVIIDISMRAADDPDTAVTPDDLDAWEQQHGEIPSGAFVAMNSGWSRHITVPDAFVNQDADGVMHYPGFHPDAAAFLVVQRGIVGLGTDTLSLDPGTSTDFGTHVAVLGAGKYGIEGLAALDQVPASGATIVVGTLKHQDASGGPARVLALI